MTNLFIDTDVIIDLLGDRKDFSLYAAKIFSLGVKKKYSYLRLQTVLLQHTIFYRSE